MNSIILCEGKTDAVLLSYYLIRVFGWEYTNKPPKALKENNTDPAWYKKDDKYLMIYPVGGKDNFKNIIDNYLSKILHNYDTNKGFSKIIILADKDDDSIEQIEQRHAEWLSPFVNEIKDREWKKSTFIGEYEEEKSIEVLSIIIPIDKQGALETTLVEAIKESNYDKIIADKCSDFINNISEDAKQYIKSKRLQLKAKLAVILAVMYPEKVFTPIDSLIKSVEWEKYEIINECFSLLGKI